MRLIGIDAPETKINPRAEKQAERSEKDLKGIVQMGEESTTFVKRLLKPGEKVRLELDGEKRDKY